MIVIEPLGDDTFLLNFLSWILQDLLVVVVSPLGDDTFLLSFLSWMLSGLADDGGCTARI